MNANQSKHQGSNQPSGANAGRDASNFNIPGNGNVINFGNMGASQPESPKKPPSKIDSTIIVALIGVVGVIASAVLASPLIEKWLFPTPTPTATPLSSPPTSPLPSAADPVGATFTPGVTLLLPTPTFTATLTPAPGDTMFASLQASMDEGKAPLNVNFDARSSYIRFADGTTATCGDSLLCSFTFAVYLNGKTQITVDNKSGLYSHTFSGKGQYFVTLYVCRGNTCDDDGVGVNVR